MSRIVLVLLVILAVFSAGSSGQQCGPNEEWKTCGTACPLTCQMQYSHICDMACMPGCQCKDGFVRKDDGGCVLPKDC